MDFRGSYQMSITVNSNRFEWNMEFIRKTEKTISNNNNSTTFNR